MIPTPISLKGLLLRCLLIVCFLDLLCGQTNFGSVQGIVVDETDAAVPNARITLNGTDTGFTRTEVANAAGVYFFGSLLPGAYTLTAEAKGFQSYQQNAFQVRLGEPTHLDVKLTVGSNRQVVTVSDAAPLLRADDSSIGDVIGRAEIQQTPLNGRNVNNLLVLVPGVVPGGSTQGAVIGNTTNGAITNSIAFGNYQIGVSFGGQSSFYIDGVQANVPENNNNTLIPTQELVQEFRVTTNLVSAEYGQTGGGVVNIATRSGANNYHAEAFEYFQNSVLNANNFFSNRNGTAKPPVRQNEFGGYFGGPIKKDKVFFLFGADQTFKRSGYPSINTVPTLAEREGDFSAKGLPGIYNLVTVGKPQFACNGVLNVICPSQLDPAAVKIINTLYPLPNLPTLTNNYVVGAKVGGTAGQYVARLDESFGSKDNLFARYTYWNPKSDSSDPFGTLQGYGTSGSTTQQAVVGDTYAFESGTIMDLRLSFLRFNMFQQPLSRGYDISSFGPNYQSLASAFGATELPALSIAGISGGANNSQLYWFNNIYTLSGSVSKTWGRHNLKAGAYFKPGNWITQQNNQGLTFTATAAFTAGPNVKGSGSGLASFLLGVPATSSVTQVGGAHQQIDTYGFYLLDNFQVNKRLTLNLGLRWDQPGAYSEQNNYLTIFKPGLPSGLGSFVNPVSGSLEQLTGALVYGNSPQYPFSTTAPLHWDLFALRAGVAYRASSTTVVRVGYGVLYLPATLSQDGPTTESINSASTSLSNIPGAAPATTISNPFPAGVVQPPRNNPNKLSQLYGQTLYSSFGFQPAPYVQQWNAAVEQALNSRTKITLSYAGSKGTHLLLEGNGTQSRLNVNQIPDQSLASGSQLTTQVANPLFGRFTSGPLSSPAIAEGYLLLPFPQFQQVYEQVPAQGVSSYNALQVSLSSRFLNSGFVQLAYTYSRLWSDTDSIITFLDGVSQAGQIQNNNNIKGEWSQSLQNIPQNLVVSYGIDLPVGRGKRLLPNAAGFLQATLGGWRVNGISTFRSGQPLAFLNGGTTLSSSFGANQIRPNYISGCNRGLSGSASERIISWFNTACFVSPGQLAFGSEPRVDPTLRADNIANWDVSLTKSIRLSERFSAGLSANFYNIFNHVQFAPPDTNLSSATYGQVTAQANLPRTIEFVVHLLF